MLLFKLGLQASEIHSVEIIGASPRVPALKNTVEAIFGKQPSTTLNQDEAVARGCAIQCAMMSHTVRVRDIEIMDAAYYPVNISWDSVKPGIEPGEMEVFKKYHSYPFTKLLTFPHRVEPFCFKAYYRNDVSVPHLNRQIGMVSCISIILPFTPTVVMQELFSHYYGVGYHTNVS